MEIQILEGNSFSEKLENEIRIYAHEVIQKSAICKLAREGKLENWHVANFIFNIYELIVGTQKCFDIAIEKSSSIPKLKNFFEEKKSEEKGHEYWAIDDLKVLRIDREDLFKTDSMDKILKSIRYVCENCPEVFVVYQLFAEMITVIISPVWIKDISEKCHIDSKALSVLVKHVELDKYHVQEDIKTVKDYINSKDLEELSSLHLEKFKKMMLDHYEEVVLKK